MYFVAGKSREAEKQISSEQQKRGETEKRRSRKVEKQEKQRSKEAGKAEKQTTKKSRKARIQNKILNLIKTKKPSFRRVVGLLFITPSSKPF